MIINGRIQSRVYLKNINGEMAEKVAYEVSVSRVTNESKPMQLYYNAS